MIARVTKENSVYDLFIFILTRLMSRYDQPTLDYLREHTKGDPLFDIDDGAGKVYKTTKMIRNMVSSWKAADKLMHKPMSQQELKNLDQKCAEVMNQSGGGPEVNHVHLKTEQQKELPSSVSTDNRDRWAQCNHTVKFSPSNVQLPTLAGCLVNPRGGDKVPQAFLADTGASISVISLQTLQKLGIAVTQLKNDVSFTVSTAVNSTEALGYIPLPCFLTDVRGSMYRIFVNWVVIKSNTLTRSIIGIDTLIALQYRMEWKPPNEHLLTIWSVSEAFKHVRRTFSLQNPMATTVFRNKDTVEPGKQTAVFTSNQFPAYRQGSQLAARCNASEVQISPPEARNPEEYIRVICNNNGDPVKMYTEIQLDVYSMNISHGPDSLEVSFDLPEETKDEMVLRMFDVNSAEELEEELNHIQMEDDQHKLQYIMNNEVLHEGLQHTEPEGEVDAELRQGLEDDALEEAMDVLDPSVDKDVGTEPGPKIPSTAHLPGEQANMLHQLFISFLDVFSQHPADLGHVTAVPPAQAVLRPGAKLVPEGRRRYAPNEIEIMRTHVEEMLAANIIEEIPPCGAEKIHWLHLLPKHSKVKYSIILQQHCCKTV